MSLGDLFRQAKEIQQRTEALQERISAIEVEGVSGAGLVRVTLNGKNELGKVEIDPSLLSESERNTIQDLLVAAHRDAKTKLDARVADEMRSLTGMLGLPKGFGLNG
ncbi:MAG: YbaB/EbfC family nucleoid-associated protein [Alphaproteobacteria bacterium]|nr:YbaB/EbfC family nucleoid-associated protein [Alphaproteobacteria bacterium]